MIVRCVRDFWWSFGWLNEYFAKVLTTDGDLLATLFELDPYRMHVLGLGLAHLEPALPLATIIENLGRRSPKTTLRQILGRWPPGLDRILHALPETTVLALKSYRALIAILDDRAIATHLHHRQNITEPLITALAELPPTLRRPAIFKLFDDIDGMDRFVVGLHFLSDGPACLRYARRGARHARPYRTGQSQDCRPCRPVTVARSSACPTDRHFHSDR